MKGTETTVEALAAEHVGDLRSQVRDDNYVVDLHDVADAVLLDVASSWVDFTRGRARALGALDREDRR